MTLTGGIDQSVMDKDYDDEGLLDLMAKKVQRADREYLKEKKDMAPSIHIFTRCLSCRNVIVYHILLPGTKDDNHFFVEHLPYIVRDMLKKHRCKEHGLHRYAGYVLSSLCRMATAKLDKSRKLPELTGDFNKYINLLVSTETVRTITFPVGEDFSLGPSKELPKGEGAGGLVNIFSVIPKKKDRDNDIYR